MKDKSQGSKASATPVKNSAPAASDSPELIKYRLLGAVVTFVLLALFGPDILDGSGRVHTTTFIEIPERPDVPPPPLLKPPAPKGTGFDEASKEKALAKHQADAKKRLEEVERQRAKEAQSGASSKATASDAQKMAASHKVAAQPAKKTPLPPKAPLLAEQKPAWTLQLATFSQPKNAYALREKLTKAGFNSYSKLLKDSSGQTRYQVFVGPELKKQTLVKVKDQLAKKLKLKDGLIKPYRP